MNREAYLNALTALLRPKFEELKSPLPEHLHISVGFPSRGALSAKKRRIGECWDGCASKDGAQHIFISPLLGAEDAAHVLVHELAHAALPSGTAHKRPFASLAKKLGLEGKPTATVAGDELKSELANMLTFLGDYPHAVLSHEALERKKQSTRMKKVTCPECGYTVRTTAKWLEKGNPLCPEHGEMLPEESEEDESSEEDAA